MHAYIHSFIHTYIHTDHTYIHTCIHSFIHTYMGAVQESSSHTHIHSYIRTYTHTYRGAVQESSSLSMRTLPATRCPCLFGHATIRYTKVRFRACMCSCMYMQAWDAHVCLVTQLFAIQRCDLEHVCVRVCICRYEMPMTVWSRNYSLYKGAI